MLVATTIPNVSNLNLCGHDNIRVDASLRAQYEMSSGNRSLFRFVVAASSILVVTSLFWFSSSSFKTLLPFQSLSPTVQSENLNCQALCNTIANTSIGSHGNLEAPLNLKQPTLPPADDDEYLAICLPIKDQRHDLPEFLIHHYHHHGIRRFYLMDDGSVPPLETTPYYGIPASSLTFHYYDREAGQHLDMMQYKVFNDCNRLFGHRHTWIAYIDTDEFFETTGAQSLHEVLREFDSEEYDEVGALAVNWRTHTSNGHLWRQISARKSFTRCMVDMNPSTTNAEVMLDEANALIENFTYANVPSKNMLYYDNLLVKSIVKTSAYLEPKGPHVFWLKHGKKTVGEDGKELTEVRHLQKTPCGKLTSL